MKILLMNVPDQHVGKTTDDWDIEASDIGIFPPMGIMYLAGALEKQGRHEVVLVDSILLRLGVADIQERVGREKPDLVGLTVYTPNLFDALQVTKALRAAYPGVIIVWGGPHTSLFPLESMTHDCVDYLVLGEAEETFPAFCDALEQGTSFTHIPGLYYRENGEPKSTGAPGYVSDIDSIAFPAFHLLKYEKYFSAIGTGKPVGTICSSRGCPFSCTFCCKPYSSYRSRSIENILAEMTAYYEKGIREFFFFDDLFNATPKRVMTIAHAITDKGWDIVWSFRGRVDAVTEEMLKIAKRSGCRQILYGVEDATDEGLEAINKKIKIKQVYDAIRLTRAAGIHSSTNWIIGFPHHRTKEHILHLIETAREVDSDWAQFNICIAYHGTALFQQGVDLGLFDKNLWVKQALHPRPNFVEPIWDQHMSRSELSALLKMCYQRFYFRPRLILRKLLAISSLKQFLLHVRGALTILGFSGYHRDQHQEDVVSAKK